MDISLSIVVPLQREVTAELDIYSVDEHAFDEASVELAGTFAAYAGVALANMHLSEAQGQVAEQLQTAMHSRAVIDGRPRESSWRSAAAGPRTPSPS